MKKLTYLIIHCTATREGVKVTRQDIERWHLVQRGWSRVGYSDMIHLDGTIENLRYYNDDHIVDDNEMTWGVKGVNGISRHVVYAGGLDENYKPSDTRSEKQLLAMAKYIKKTIEKHPHIKIAGHNDFANKDCPCFDVGAWLTDVGVPPINIHKPKFFELNKEGIRMESKSFDTSNIVNLDKYKGLQLSTVDGPGKYGIDATVKVVDFGISLANAIIYSYKDGELNLFDLQYAIKPLMKVPAAFKNIKQVGKELGELDSVERATILNKIKSELNVDDVKAQRILDKSLKAVDALYDLVDEIVS